MLYWNYQSQVILIAVWVRRGYLDYNIEISFIKLSVDFIVETLLVRRNYSGIFKGLKDCLLRILYHSKLLFIFEG